MAKKQVKILRQNQDKLNWGLVHFKSLEPMVKVLMYGTKKYGTNGITGSSTEQWKEYEPREILESAMRHLTKILDGELIDPESNELHSGHLMCNILFYNYFLSKNNEECTQKKK